ncbi:hypothetical protein ACGF5M_06450 [Gemmatimonadota bacterium]
MPDRASYGASRVPLRVTLQWLGVCAATTAIDLFARIGLHLSVNRALWVEAVLLLAAGLVLSILLRRGPSITGVTRIAQLLVVAVFFMGGLRAGLWAGGWSVERANLLVLTVTVIAWAGHRIDYGRRATRG